MLRRRDARVKVGERSDNSRDAGKQRTVKPERLQAELLSFFLHIGIDVRKQVAKLLPFLSPGLDGVVFRQKAGQVLPQSPLDRIAEGQRQDSGGSLGFGHAAEHRILC